VNGCRQHAGAYGFSHGTAPALLTRMHVPLIKHVPLTKRALPLVVVSFAPLMTGCQVIEGIFKAGVWVGVLGVFAVIALIVWAMKSLFR
jgi:hypothetical protein